MPEGLSLKSPPRDTRTVQQTALKHTESETATKIPGHGRRGRILLIAGILILLSGGLLAAGLAMGLIGEANEETDADIAKLKAAAKQAQTAHGEDPAEKDKKLCAAIIGEWEMPEDGIYRLSLKPDNTGTLVYLPNSKFKILLAWTSRLEIQIKWSLENGHVDMWSLSGKPQRAFKIAIADRGKQKYYRINELTAETMILHEIKKNKTDHWKRITSTANKEQ